MSVGALVSDGVETVYNELESDKKHRYVIYKLTDGSVIETDTTGERSATFADFAEKLRQSYADQCRWAVFDYAVEREGGTTADKKLFICWCPDQAPMRQQMIYVSTKETLRKQLVGINLEIKASCVEEIELAIKTAALH